jgi:flagellar biosynthesis protein FlhF
MQVKQYREATVREAFRAIREELGPTALVHSSELVSARGWRGLVGMREVRVTASAAGVAPHGAPAEPATRRSAVAERRRTDTVRGGGVLVARLTAAGVDQGFAEQVAAGVSARDQRGMSTAGVRRTVAEYLAPLAVQDDETYAQVEVFIGPPGVGKTTTIAKIAAQERVRHHRSLGMVAADAFRAGAIEQLRTYAAIIGAPFRTARTIEEMDQAIESSRQTLLVDTAGRSPADDDLRDVRRLLGRRQGVRTHLVVPADASVAAARRIFRTFADAQPDRVVLSKVDEAESPSSLIAWLLERGVPVSYVTTGQRVPDDLERATPATLAAALLRDAHASMFAGVAS